MEKILEYIEKHNDPIQKIKQLYPDLPEDIVEDIYKTSISLRQSYVCKSGKNLEKVLEIYLETLKIPFKREINIDETGMIVSYTSFHKIDFVLGNPKMGDSITDYIIISCKKTCRERWMEDSWTLNIPPKKYILFTKANDYPNSTKFMENERRKIITKQPKKRDNRQFPLVWDDLIEEIINV